MNHIFDSGGIECLDENCRYCGLPKYKHQTTNEDNGDPI